jgi:GMP synthase (glutamine-hydrolysing)
VTPRLWIIDPSLRWSEDQGVSEVLGDWPGERRIFQPALKPGDGPAPGTGYDTDGIVVLGSAASVHDDRPWIEDLASWLAPVLDGRRAIPVLGVCFGHQLIAHVAGGTVDWVKPDHAKTLGVDQVTVRESRLVEEPSLRAIFSHREEVSIAPSSYRTVAWREAGDLDGIEHESLPIFSYQFHPEARDEFAVRAGIDPREIDDRVIADTRRLLSGFRVLVTRRTRAT